ncbi:uncharacterized protein LOC117337531 [Pecten maximus]|uniref:uncharacterized protein LOC117337531 n=1 Tax=Pecten maximus TaxID=6579 RepID=UPI00145830C7|nr:uncharacterized protein LOC117337531 [Pecten maximus]
MSTVQEMYTGEVIGCDIGGIKLQIHLPCDDDDDDDDDDESDDFPENQPLLLNCNGGPSNGAPSSGHVTVQRGGNRRKLTRRQMSTPTNLTSSTGISNGNTVPVKPRPPPFTRRQTLPSKLLHSITETPGDIALKETTYDISENSSTQINISWTPPLNSNVIPNLVYEIQLQKENDSDWINLSERGIPIVRVYTTETRFILDGERRSFSEGHCTWRLRIRGVSKDQDMRSEGPWSKVITLNIVNSSSEVPDSGIV